MKRCLICNKLIWPWEASVLHTKETLHFKCYKRLLPTEIIETVYYTGRDGVQKENGYTVTTIKK